MIENMPFFSLLTLEFIIHFGFLSATLYFDGQFTNYKWLHVNYQSLEYYKTLNSDAPQQIFYYQ